MKRLDMEDVKIEGLVVQLNWYSVVICEGANSWNDCTFFLLHLNDFPEFQRPCYQITLLETCSCASQYLDTTENLVIPHKLQLYC